MRQEGISMRRDWDVLSANVYVAGMMVKKSVSRHELSDQLLRCWDEGGFRKCKKSP